MVKISLGLVALVLFGALRAAPELSPPGLARPASAGNPTAPTALTGGAIADYYKIIRAQYVNLAGNSGTYKTTCYLTNNRVQPITLKEVYVLGPGGTTTILATYTGFVGVQLPPLGQVQFTVDSVMMPSLIAEPSVNGPGVKSVVAGWHGPDDAVDLTAVIERNDNGNNYSRSSVSHVGVPLTL